MPQTTNGLVVRLQTVAEMARLLRRTGRWWLWPVFVMLFILGLALASLQAMPYIAPFIYAVF
jgi:hypothetical protein